MSRSSDEEHYLSSIHAVYTHNKISNPYIYEDKDKTNPLYFSIIEYVLGFFGKIFNIPISVYAIAMKFFIPALLFLVIYLFLKSLLNNDELGAIFSSLLIMFGNELARFTSTSIQDTILWHSPFIEFLVYSRPVNPSVSSIFFFLDLYFILCLFKKPKDKISLCMASFFSGVLSYVYLYFWMFVTVLNLVVLIYSLYFKKRDLFKFFLLNFLGSIIIAFPFLYKIFELINAHSQSVLTDAIYKAYIPTHRLILEKIVMLPLFIYVLIFLTKYLAPKCIPKYSEIFSSFLKKHFFIYILLIVSLIVSNQQVITGMEIQQHHFHFFTNIPVFLIAISVIFLEFLNLYAIKFKKIFLILFIIFVTFHAVGVQASSYKIWKPSFSHYQDYRSVFDWLNNNSEADSVIYANSIISEMIPIYTKNYPYSAVHAAVYSVSVVRLMHNYFINTFLKGIEQHDANSYFSNEIIRNDLGQMVFEGQYWKDTCGSYGCFSDAVITRVVNAYKDFLKQSFQTQLKKYKINYLLWDVTNDPEWQADRFLFLKKVYEYNHIILYEVQ